MLTTLPERKQEYVVGEGFVEREYQFPDDKNLLLQSRQLLIEMNRPFETREDDIVLGRWLGFVANATKSRKNDQESHNVSMEYYMNSLSDYPVYHVIKVLKEWHKSPEGMWWPSLAELDALLKENSAKTKMMLRDLELKIENLNNPKIAKPIYSAVDQEAKDDDERRKTGLLMKLHRLGFFKDHENAAIKEFTKEFISKPFDICERVVKMYQQQIEVTL